MATYTTIFQWNKKVLFDFWQLFECETIVKRFASVMADLEEALDVNIFKLLDISDEVREQVCPTFESLYAYSATFYVFLCVCVDVLHF
mgnify:FL=1